MANKRATYKVEFSFNGLSLAEQDRVYRKLLSVLDRDLKDRLELKVTDLLGGEHDIFSNRGVRPDKVVCESCPYVECGDCKIWKKVVELNKEKEEKENKSSNG